MLGDIEHLAARGVEGCLSLVAVAARGEKACQEAVVISEVVVIPAGASRSLEVLGTCT